MILIAAAKKHSSSSCSSKSNLLEVLVPNRTSLSVLGLCTSEHHICAQGLCQRSTTLPPTSSLSLRASRAEKHAVSHRRSTVGSVVYAEHSVRHTRRHVRSVHARLVLAPSDVASFKSLAMDGGSHCLVYLRHHRRMLQFLPQPCGFCILHGTWRSKRRIRGYLELDQCYAGELRKHYPSLYVCSLISLAC